MIYAAAIAVLVLIFVVPISVAAGVLGLIWFLSKRTPT